MGTLNNDDDGLVEQGGGVYLEKATQNQILPKSFNETRNSSVGEIAFIAKYVIIWRLWQPTFHLKSDFCVLFMSDIWSLHWRWSGEFRFPSYCTGQIQYKPSLTCEALFALQILRAVQKHAFCGTFLVMTWVHPHLAAHSMPTVIDIRT